MELRMYLRMLQRGWWLIALCTLAALGAALTFSYLSEPIYRTAARFVVSPDAGLSTTNDVINSISTLDKRSIVNTYSDVLQSDTIYSQAVDALKLSAESVTSYERSVVVLPDSNVLEISVQGPDPQIAVLLANSIGNEAITYIDALNQGYNIRVLDPAQPPSEPISPKPTRDASLAVLFGLVLGASLAIVREQILAPLESFLKRNTIDRDSGVLNRQFFDQLTDETLARTAPGGLHALGLVHLSGLGDYIGVIPQPEKQRVMHQIAKILSNELRGNDIVGRWDDATFAVLLPGTAARAAELTLGRVQTMLSREMNLNDMDTIKLLPRIGFAERQEQESSETLRENAKQALKQAMDGSLSLVLYRPEAAREDGRKEQGKSR